MPHLEKFSVEAMNNSAPVIRPLWMLDPHDPFNQVQNDTFLIGDKVSIFQMIRFNLLVLTPSSARLGLAWIQFMISITYTH